MFQAIVCFQKNDIPGALACYQRVLKLNPEMIPDVRVSIGLCYHKLGMMDHARRAFERTIERVQSFCFIDISCQDPLNVTAQTLLSILDSNAAKLLSPSDPQRKELVSNASQRLAAAFKTQKKHPLAALQLAHKFFVRKEYSKVVDKLICLMQSIGVCNVRCGTQKQHFEAAPSRCLWV